MPVHQAPRRPSSAGWGWLRRTASGADATATHHAYRADWTQRLRWRLPLMLDGRGMSFTDAFFETASGLTTTGATTISGLDALAPSINFWRHLTNWIGGMGIIVLTVAILPLLGVGGMQLFKAETPGPMKDSKLTPRIASTAKALWLVYVGTVACVLASRPWTLFDAVCHAFSVMALGGFPLKRERVLRSVPSNGC
jgi:Trk-type K+ transport system membrane component